jgi:hypothetical protein
MRLLRLVLVPRAVQLFFVAVVTLASSACGAAARFQPLDVRDVVVAPSVRVGKNLYTTERTQFAAEANASWISGGDTNSLVTQARIGDTNFDPPGTLRTDFDLSVYDASFRWRHVLNSVPVGFELGAGFAYLDLDIAGTSSSNFGGAESVSSPGGRFSIGAIWRMSPTMDLAATATAFGTTKSNLSNGNAFEIMLERRFTKRFLLRGGYANWDLDAPSTTRSDIFFRFHGLSIGVGRHF